LRPVRFVTTLNDVNDQGRHADSLTLASESAGAVDRGTCRIAGMSDGGIEWLVSSGRWQSPFPRVFVTFSGPIPHLTMEHAAILYAGDGAVLSHESAGCYWHLGSEARAIHVTVPYARVVEDRPSLVIHRSRTLREEDVHPVLAPRRTRIERTVLDLLAGKRSADEALGLVADAVRDRATTADRLKAALDRRPNTRWRKVILEALPDVGAGAHSALEIRDAKLRRRHGLPMGKRQVGRLGDGTEYLDIVIEEWRLHVELDGRLGHDRGRERWRDMRRDNRSEVQQFRHLRYGWSDMVDRPCEVALEQAVILRQQGWKGEFRACRSCPTTV
jgi:hypothetical protein